MSVLPKEPLLFCCHSEQNWLKQLFPFISGPWCRGRSVGVMGVIECSFLNPAHNKEAIEEVKKCTSKGPVPKAAAWRGVCCDTAFVLSTVRVLRSVHCEVPPH